MTLCSESHCFKAESDERLGFFVEAFEWREDEYAVHIAIEYCNGGDLRSFANDVQQSAMKGSHIGVFVSIFTQMARGLAYMHSIEFAHGDFTPKVCFALLILDRATLT